MMVTFFKHDIPDWMDGTEDLDDAEYRVYHVICQLIYLNEGPIANNEHGIAGRCKQSIRTYRRCLEKLVELGKITLESGRIGNERAFIELKIINENRFNAARGGFKSRGVKKSIRKSLETNDQATAPLSATNSLRDKTRQEETRQDNKNAAPNGARPGELDLGQAEPPRPPPRSDPEVDLFRRGKEVLGNSAGGMISRLLQAKDRNVAMARAAIEQASTKHDPREYIGGVIRGRAEEDKPRVIV
jgi:uncharacterized protein YdaU (DUF1376 family)